MTTQKQDVIWAKDPNSQQAYSSNIDTHSDCMILESSSGTNAPMGGAASKGGCTWLKLKSQSGAFGLFRGITQDGKEVIVDNLTQFEFIATGDAEGRNLIRALGAESSKLQNRYSGNQQNFQRKISERLNQETDGTHETKHHPQ